MEKLQNHIQQQGTRFKQKNQQSGVKNRKHGSPESTGTTNSIKVNPHELSTYKIINNVYWGLDNQAFLIHPVMLLSEN